ncbi:hypothetical protein BDY19DRAFT_646534 [Irpex rosettiformis]|uniref:Uncharacterized protein n=1 Tax=Irpex rosettiformis TaxID=378272 RepID=A0ACB8UBV6_9APHY|nr:hypothetical protein BDY19DRAFT_646534 [Irpex rosettiformis]
MSLTGYPWMVPKDVDETRTHGLYKFAYHLHIWSSFPKARLHTNRSMWQRSTNNARVANRRRRNQSRPPAQSSPPVRPRLSQRCEYVMNKTAKLFGGWLTMNLPPQFVCGNELWWTKGVVYTSVLGYAWSSDHWKLSQEAPTILWKPRGTVASVVVMKRQLSSTTRTEIQ